MSSKHLEKISKVLKSANHQIQSYKSARQRISEQLISLKNLLEQLESVKGLYHIKLPELTERTSGKVYQSIQRAIGHVEKHKAVMQECCSLLERQVKRLEELMVDVTLADRVATHVYSSTPTTFSTNEQVHMIKDMSFILQKDHEERIRLLHQVSDSLTSKTLSSLCTEWENAFGDFAARELEIGGLLLYIFKE